MQHPPHPPLKALPCTKLLPHSAPPPSHPLFAHCPCLLARCRRSYAQQLASWGFAAVLYDLSDVLLDDTLTVTYLRCLMDACDRDRRLAAVADPRTTYLVGHSRGGKLSTLAAGQVSGGSQHAALVWHLCMSAGLGS
jgi:hypothetical protein